MKIEELTYYVTKIDFAKVEDNNVKFNELSYFSVMDIVANDNKRS